jgi:hypothetical protein
MYYGIIESKWGEDDWRDKEKNYSNCSSQCFPCASNCISE